MRVHFFAVVDENYVTKNECFGKCQHNKQTNKQPTTTTTTDTQTHNNNNSSNNNNNNKHTHKPKSLIVEHRGEKATATSIARLQRHDVAQQRCATDRCVVCLSYVC
jgi:hypothetical protein